MSLSLSSSLSPRLLSLSPLSSSYTSYNRWTPFTSSISTSYSPYVFHIKPSIYSPSFPLSSVPSTSFSSYSSPSPSPSPSPPISPAERAQLNRPLGALPRCAVVPSPTLEGARVLSTIGLVTGNTVRVRNFAFDAFNRWRALFGGELSNYTLLMIDSREEATARMTEEAVALGANAIVNVRYTTSNLADNASEIFVYGTAVYVEYEGDREGEGQRITEDYEYTQGQEQGREVDNNNNFIK